ncbi:MAG: sel1 repeat family protein [Acidobacteriaceae bacterium]|nr:sel1 repeat family protein [Acidobacteriaceae bacterium]
MSKNCAINAILACCLVLGLCSFRCDAQNADALFAKTSAEEDVKAAEAGDTWATIRAGYRYLTGEAGRISPEKAASYFVRAVDHSPEASAWLGYSYISTYPNDPNLQVSGLRLLQDGTQSNNPVAETLLGRVYQLGLAGQSPNIESARALYMQAAPSFALAKTYLAEIQAKAKDYQGARSLCQDATTSGETDSMVLLATMYLNGLGGPRDTSAAIQLLNAAVARWNPRAAYRLGLIYRDGEFGLNRNPTSAFRLFKRSAQLRFRPAETALGICYAEGIGVEQDYAAAAYWLRKAASNDPVAQRWLATTEQHLQSH